MKCFVLQIFVDRIWRLVEHGAHRKLTTNINHLEHVSLPNPKLPNYEEKYRHGV
jgi:hypothetical protein